MTPAMPLILLCSVFLLFGCSSNTQFELADAASPYAYQYQWEPGRIYHTRTGVEVSEQELYDYLSGFTVVYIGESHDSVNDHQVQLKILEALARRFPGEVALGLEMLRTDSQAEADRWAAGQLTEKEMMRLWSDNWGAASYPYYREILNFVRQEGIALVALNRPQASASAEHGSAADSATPVQPALPPEPDIDRDDPYYEAYISAFLSGHGNELDPEMRQKFLRAQLLWDETMADSGARFLKQPASQNKRLVILAGANHVRYGFGIPRRLFRRLPVNYVIVDPRVVAYTAGSADKLMDVELPELPLPVSDITWMVDYEDLEDQRVTLGVAIAPAEDSGVLVREVHAGSPAASAGLYAGDVIIGLDGEKVDEMFDLTYQLSTKVVGQKGTITILRNQETLTMEISYENYAKS